MSDRALPAIAPRPAPVPRRFAHLLLRSAAFALCAEAVQAGGAAPAEPLQLSLVSERSGLVPGERAWLGLLLRHAPHWHTYWLNPGDSGLPTRLRWTLPEGYVAGEPAWPAPERFEVGALTNLGYSGELLLPIALDVPDLEMPGTEVLVQADVRWLACEVQCVPGRAQVALNLPVLEAHEAAVDAASVPAFAAARARLPQVVDWPGSAVLEGGRIAIEFQPTESLDATQLELYAITPQLLDPARPAVRVGPEGLRASALRSADFVAAPAELELVLSERRDGAWRAWQLKLPLQARGAAAGTQP